MTARSVEARAHVKAYHGRRALRTRLVRAVTVSIRHTPKAELEAMRAAYPEPTAHLRPRVRVECEDGPRPCPFVSCKHHLFVDVSPRTGAIKFNFPDLEVWEMGESCALDVAERGGMPLEGVAAVLNLTRERVRQLEHLACLAIAHTLKGYK